LGAVLSGFSLWLVLWLNRRRRKLLDDRPPERSKLLRPPGYSLQQKLEALNDRSDTLLALLIGCGTVLGLFVGGLAGVIAAGTSVPIRELFSVRMSGPLLGLVLFGVGSLLLGAWTLLRLSQLNRELRACRLGLRGEQAVAETLNHRSVLEAGYTSFHDVPGDGNWNIDHVVVGPAGIFVLETKTRSKRKSLNGQEEHKVLFDGRKLQFPWCFDDQAAQQVVRNAEWIKELLRNFGPSDIPIQPIVVVPGWYVETKGKFPILAMNAKYLSLYLTRQSGPFSQGQLMPLIRRIEERCRNLEF